MARRKMLRVFFPSNQIVNLQMLYHPYLKVFVNQLSQKQTLSIRSMYKLCLGKKNFPGYATGIHGQISCLEQ